MARRPRKAVSKFRVAAEPAIPARELLELADRLHSTAIHLLRRVRKQDVAVGQGPARLSALSVLVFGGTKTLGELAAAEQVKPPTMSRVVQGLEADGLVRRASDSRDGRIVRLHATARGRRVMQRGRERRVANLARLFCRLAPAGLERVREAAELVERVLAQQS